MRGKDARPAAMPGLSTGHAVIDRAFAMAMDDIAANVVPYRQQGLMEAGGRVLKAGADYGFWIRDAAINSWNGFGLMLPEVNRASMLPFLDKTASGYRFNKDDQLWDAIIWIVGAWWHYLQTLDQDFLALALEIGRDLMGHYERTWQDPRSGLFVGGSVTADGSTGYPDELVGMIREKDGIRDWGHWRQIRNDPRQVDFKSLSTNCIYYYAYTILHRMETLLGGAADGTWQRKARKIKSAINRHLWDSRRGYYQYVIHDRYQYNYQDAMGHSFCLLFGIANAARACSVFARQHTTRFGVPINWPSFARFKPFGKQGHYGHVNCLVWPEVNGFWAHAAACYKQYRIFEFELLNLAKLAVRDGQFFEAFHPDTGKPYGGLSDYPMTPDHPRFEKSNYFMWQVCGRQVWCATAYFRMISRGILGMEFSPDGITFKPYLPTWLKTITLTGLVYADRGLSVQAQGKGNRIKRFILNGKQVEKRQVPARGQGDQRVELVMG